MTRPSSIQKPSPLASTVIRRESTSNSSVQIGCAVRSALFFIAAFESKPSSHQAEKQSYTVDSLIEPIFNGRVEIIKTAINDGLNVNARSEDKTTLLSFAAMYGQLEIAQILVKAGAEVNAKTGCERTPIIEAAEFGHFEVVEFLLEMGADVHAKESMGGRSLSILQLVRRNLKEFQSNLEIFQSKLKTPRKSYDIQSIEKEIIFYSGKVENLNKTIKILKLHRSSCFSFKKIFC